MQIATRKAQDILVIDLSGRLDSRSVGDADDRFAAIASGPDLQVVVNLAAVDFVSSAGLRLILRLSRLLQAHGGELKLSDAQPMVANVLDTAGFDSLLHIHPREADAIAAFHAH
jgi:anti-anti-sigma factor